MNFTHDDEAAMVENIVNVVGDHSEEGQWREPFRHEVRGLGFREARNLIKENAVRSNVLMPDRVDLYNHKIRGYRTQHTTTTTKPEIITTTNTFVQPPVLSRPPPPPVATTTTHH